MSTDDRHSDEAFIEQIRRALDAEPLPHGVAARLAAGRHNAVAAIPTKPVYVPNAWLPVGALAATLVAVVLLRPAMAPDSMTPFFDDDTQFAAAEDLDFLENLEFAAWMDESESGDEG